ncbi:nijmegen breakage syndrome protein 1 [Angomonas deanei]|uniref:Uncharacterized protein n=1 Tax=Angomonas deanei TaxID=59799 RepID=A0A7G2CD98_9TRYP|nr:nijmegen breakage syndrome protein 1 [Angomonas deanei]CAD2216917.1 hypothetical protein, conserved [Angomonas deanei]|eukprot:EPY18511.1 nijmegen breakage syndrome protein 1 [Angomonas deanei]
MSSPDSSPIVHRDAPEPVIRRPDGPPTSRRLLTSPNRDSGPSQPKDRSATAPPRDSEEREIPSGEVQEVQPSSDAEVTSVPLMDENFILPSRNHNNNNNKQPPAASGAKFNKVPARPGYSDDSSSFSDEDYPPQTTSPKALPASLPPLHPNSLPASAKSSPAQSYIKANRSKPSENDTAKSSTSESKPPSKPIVDDDDDEEPSLSFFNSAHTPQGQERSNSNSGSRSSSNSDEQRREPAEQPAPASDSTGIAALPRLQRSAPPADSPVAPPRLQPAGPGRSNLSQSNSVNHTTTSQPAERSTTPDAVGPVLSEPQKPSPSRPTRRTTEITVDEDELLMEADEEEEQEPPSGKRDTVSPADLTERKEEITADEDSLEEPQEEKKKPSLGLPPMASGTPSLSEMPQPAAPLQPSPKPQDSGRKDLNSKESSPTPPPSLPRVNEDESGASLLQSRTADPTNVRNKGEAVAKPSAQSAASSVVSTPRSRTAELSEEDLKRKEEVSRILERIREKKELEKKRMETMSQSTDDN